LNGRLLDAVDEIAVRGNAVLSLTNRSDVAAEVVAVRRLPRLI
jgi:hypothetical protein